MKYRFMLILSGLILWQCGGLQIQKQSDLEPTQILSSGCQEQQEFSAWVRGNNTDIYWGEGFATIVENNIGEAKEKAKKSAIVNLSGHISIEIRSDLVTTVIGKEGRGMGGYEEVIQQTVKTYTQNVLNDLNESEPFIDCPAVGNLAYYVWVPKEKYRDRVKNDMEVKRTIVVNKANDGLRKWDNGEYVTSVKIIGQAMKLATDFFKGLPLMVPSTTTQDTLEIRNLLQDRMDDFFRNLHFEVLNEGFEYNAQGKINQQPIIYAYFMDKEKRKNPLPGLPLKITFSEGTGRVDSTVITKAPRGTAKLNISTINPATKSATIVLTIDDTIMEGIDLDYPPRTSIKLMKKSIVAVSVRMNGYESDVLRKRLLDQITGNLLKQGVDVIHLDSTTTAPSLTDAAKIDADYFLIIHLTVGSANTVPPYDNLYQIILSGTGEMKVVSTGMIKVSERLSVVKGFGSTPDNARGDAYGKMLAQVSDFIKKFATELQ